MTAVPHVNAPLMYAAHTSLISFAKVAAAIHAGGEDEEEEEQLQRKTARPPEHLEESPQAGRRKACRKTKLHYAIG